jgi:glycosyltransferase involved in cell wall biosynthesis
VLHDHCGFTAFAFADRVETPVLHTLHGPFTDETTAFYARHGHKARAVALSRYQAEQAPDELEVVAVIGNPMVVDDFPFRAEKDGYLLWIGRFNEDKGPNRAIAAAQEADERLILAGPVQPGNEEFFAREVEPSWTGTGSATSARSERKRAICTRGPRRCSCRSAGRSRSAS